MVVFVGCASTHGAEPGAAVPRAASEKASLAEVGVSMKEFCGHYHLWGGNGTTAPSSFHPCRPSDLGKTRGEVVPVEELPPRQLGRDDSLRRLRKG